MRCYCNQKPVVVMSWTSNNPSRRFYGCPNYWVNCQLFLVKIVDSKCYGSKNFNNFQLKLLVIFSFALSFNLEISESARGCQLFSVKIVSYLCHYVVVSIYVTMSIVSVDVPHEQLTE